MNIAKTVTIGANSSEPLMIKRFGYGTMRLTGEQIWGEPKNRPEALQILRTAVDKGIQFLDTADYYGEDVTNRLIAEALYPYSEDLVICTKVGATRGADKSWQVFNTPENLRTSIENNLRTLKVDRLSVVHYRIMPGTPTPLEEAMEAMLQMQKEGKIQHVGISNVNPTELAQAIAMGPIASVENAYGFAQRTSFVGHGMETRGLQEVMPLCEANGIVMVPFFSLQMANPEANERLAKVGERYGASAAQINLAWMLHQSDLILPIPGTSQLKHFEENIVAMDIDLSKEDLELLG